MTDDILLIDTDQRVRTLTLNRPQSRNALSAALRDRFFTALADAEADDDIDVVILTGADPVFCAGLDLKELAGADRAAGHLTAVAGDDQAGDRRDQRRRGHRRARAGAAAVLRHPVDVLPTASLNFSSRVMSVELGDGMCRDSGLCGSGRAGVVPCRRVGGLSQGQWVFRARSVRWAVG
ncbi:Putative enoyl-CoA hydratase Echa16 (enoyl hydrase) (unsaturated acyl-CoA hydratase) (crotonase) (part1) [Mycobacterium canettii CIPT 140070017]|nr:Putative enoyl-CoA hydratase Echa16 (enoyl hydrase) (unsaturated acyl-CoA hydratase) (crotonase) (part1) [Mycobacterium canettii CIPT 140070017]